MGNYHLVFAGLLLIAAPASANSIVLQCATTSGEKSQWMIGNGEVRWNYGDGWSDNRCRQGDTCYFNEHGVFIGQSAVKPGQGDAWYLDYSPSSNGELIYEDDGGGTTTFCHPS
jgi:hypothetical protein